MIYLIWLVTLVISFYLGYKLREITTKIEAVEQVLKAKVDKKPIEEPQSSLIDPTDPIKEAQYAREQLMKKMNPDE